MGSHHDDIADSTANRGLPIAYEAGGCWVWAGRIVRDHPTTYVNGSPVHAARHLFRAHHGSLPAKTRLHRLCGGSACVNPQHFCIASPDAVLKRHGRTILERRAIVGLLRLRASEPGSHGLSWEGGSWSLPPSVVQAIVTAVACPPLVVHCAHAWLCARNWGPTRDEVVAAKRESEAVAERAMAILKPTEPPRGAGWLPGDSS